MSMLHRVEKCGTNDIEGEFVTLSFVTNNRGFWQCRFTHQGLNEFSGEPPLETLPKKEQIAIKEIGSIVFYFTHGELPKALSAFDT